MKHYTLIEHVADALAKSTALQTLMVTGEIPLTIQIGEDLQNPVGKPDCPVVLISSGPTDCINGRDPKTHRLSIYACFVTSNEAIAVTDPEEEPEIPEDPPAWIDPTRRKVFGCVKTADDICDSIRDAISAKFDALAKAGTAVLNLDSISRDIDSELQYPLVIAGNEIAITDANPARST
jgi:hypothetical protein